MQKGSIRVQTENIFPIIKKFLYSEHDIFLRELVSNAVDANQKLKTLSSIGEAKGELEKRIKHEGLKARIFAVETEDKMTDRQIAAKVRDYLPS